MISIRSLFILVGLLASQTCLANPDIQHWQMNNGTRVFFVELHELPMVDLQVIFDAGSARDKTQNGLAMLTSSLIAEGAAGLDANTISRNFEAHGANFSTNAGYDSASVSLRSLSDKKHLKPALVNLKRILTSPDFPESAIERQRNRMLIGIKYKQQSPDDLADDAFTAALYGNHPYAFPREGTANSLQQLTRGDIRGFYQKYYVAANAMLVMVGDLDRDEAESLAAELMNGLKTGNQAEALPDVKPLKSPQSIKINHPSAQTHILVGQPGIRRGDPDYFPLYVGNQILGGGAMVSRLFEEVREKRGLSYAVYSYFSPMRREGPFTAGLQTKNGQAQQALEVMNKELEKFIENGPTEEELNAAKKNITGGFPLNLNSNSKIANYVAMIGYYGLPMDYLDTFNDNINKVTVAEIKGAFKRRLTPENFVTVMVGNLEQGDGENN